jgi:preprotein translocase subunit SecG
MIAVLTVLHVVVCIFLMAVVLLQRGKGAEIGAVFGGGAGSTVFGGRGAGNFLTKLTTGSAIVFMITSFSLSYLWTQAAEQRLFQDEAAAEAAAPAQESVFEEVETVEVPESGAAAEPGAAAPEEPAGAAEAP